jgi:uncharacterized protein YgiM (DUF1202 family)
MTGCKKSGMPTLPADGSWNDPEPLTSEEALPSDTETSEEPTGDTMSEIVIDTEETTAAPTETAETTQETEEQEPETYPIAEDYTRVNQLVAPTVNVNLRTGPGTEYESLGLLMTGAQVERISDGGEWSQVLYEGQICYVASAYLQVLEETEPLTIPAASEEVDTEY